MNARMNIPQWKAENHQLQKAEAVQQARQWIGVLQSLTETLETLVALVTEDDGPTHSSTDSYTNSCKYSRRLDNEYLCASRDEAALRRLVHETLVQPARRRGRCLIEYKYQWYALYAELEQHGWIAAGRRGLSQFCRQMAEWFPDARVGFDYKGVVKGGEHRDDPAYTNAVRWFREKIYSIAEKK